MAKGTLRQEKKFTLELNEREAAFIMGLVQNHLQPGLEPPEETEMRHSIFEAIRNPEMK